MRLDKFTIKPQELIQNAQSLEKFSRDLTLLARKGYDPAYGARPLKRAIQQYIENPLSMELLKGKTESGVRIVADTEGEDIRFDIQ